MSDAFIREVDEDLRQKQLTDLWNKYGKFVIGIAIGIVIIVAGRGIYNYIVESKYNEQADAYAQAILENGADATTALNQIIASDVDGYEILATFKKAELALAAEDKLGAVKILDEFIATATVPTLYKDIANVQAAILEVDSASVDDVRGRLSLVLNGETNFKYIAAEIVALAELKAGDVDAAKARLEELLAGEEVPGSVKNRAEQYLSVIEE